MTLPKPRAPFRTIVLSLTLCSLAQPGSGKDIIPSPPDVPVLGELEPYLIEKLDGKIEKQKKPERKVDREAGLGSFHEDPAFRVLVKKHGLDLFNGPMVGCLTDSSARIWLRTATTAKVQVIYGEKASLEGGVRTAEQQSANDETDFTLLFDLQELKPLTTYFYDVVIDGSSAFQEKGYPSFRTYPAQGQKAKLTVAFGGGARHNPPKEHIWKIIEKRKPDALLLLGDNLYIDKEQERNVHNLYYYRRYLREEYRSLIARTAVYSIWDDHDFGLNDCVGGPAIDKPSWKVPNWKVFRRNWVNPGYGGGEERPGCWYQFSMGDVDFFMTDGRFYRSFKDGTMLGPHQKKWLIESLQASKATFKVIASGTLWTETADKGGKDSWEGVKEEREEIFDVIRQHKIGGVILISADRHRADIYKLERPGLYPLYEFESSKLTNNHTHGTKKQAVFSYNKGNFYGHLEFDLTKEDPEVTHKVITSDDKEVYSLTLKRSLLTVPE